MKDTEIIFPHGAPIPEDKNGNVYVAAVTGCFSDPVVEILKAIDSELVRYGLELLCGDGGSDDYFLHVGQLEGVAISLSEFDKFSDEELEAELARRHEPPLPIASEDLNISGIMHQASEYITSIEKTGRPPRDAEHYIFEAVMTSFYGHDVWDWLNEHNRG
jgi:hypothetical protein